MSDVLDPTKLTVSDADEVPRARRGNKGPNPFVDWLRESYESGQPKQVTVKNGDQWTNPERGKARPKSVAKVETMIRNAAQELGIGARIGTEDTGKDSTRIVFQGKEKRGYNPS